MSWGTRSNVLDIFIYKMFHWCLVHVFTLFIAEKVRLAQLDLLPRGTKRNYEVEKEIFLTIALVCKLSCTEWHERGRVAVVF